MSKVKYLEDSSFGIIHSETRTSLDGGETYIIYSELSEEEKQQCIEDCLYYYLEYYSTPEEALIELGLLYEDEEDEEDEESPTEEEIEMGINEIRNRIDYLLR